MEKPCTVLINFEKSDPPRVDELRKQLEGGSIPDKIEGMKTVILLMLNGEQLNSLLMTVIRFIMTVDDHTLQKLVLLYWEIVDKTSADGKLLPEMILVCNGLRNFLNHPNEYIRGSTLRFVCKLKEPDIIEPLLPSIKTNLEYKHAYVRRNAVLALYNVYKQFEHLCPDAPELVYKFLLTEGDASCKRNAFIMLFNCAQDKAVQYLSEVLDQVSSMGEVIQIIVIELIRKVCRTNPNERSKYIKCLFDLLSSSSNAVQYEAAGALISLSSAPTAVRAATSTYIDLLVKESDNNVKMIVLDRLLGIKQHYPRILQDLLMDVLRALATPNMDIRQKTLDITLDLVSPKNIDEVIHVLKKEINKTQSAEIDKADSYRQMLIHAIHACAVKFPETASSVVYLLMDFLGDTTGGSAIDVIVFVREIIETYRDLKDSILKKLLESLNTIKSPKVYRCALWVIGEYSETPDEIDRAFTALKEAVGQVPFILAEEEQTSEENKQNKKPAASHGSGTANRILPDGTYATQSAATETSATTTSAAATTSSLRGLIFGGDFFLASTLATTLTKLGLKLSEHQLDQVTKNLFTVEILTILASVIQLGQSEIPPNPIDNDSFERIVQCIRILSEPSNKAAKDVLLRDDRQSFSQLLAENQQSKPLDSKKKEVDVQIDDLIKFRQLRSKKTFGMEDLEEFDDDINKATGMSEAQEDANIKLNRIYQLTGFSDPIYAEAFVNVHQYDITLDVLVINQTQETLQNVCLELATLGDLKLVERPQTHTIGPFDKRRIKASIKVSSTETGFIFGNIVYDVAGVSASDKNCVILNEIHIDIMDYIFPASCTENDFRVMWAEFEWENKVAVNTNFSDINEFLQHILKTTNMQCLTPSSALAGDCSFLSANLYARSVFGEDALANLSIEKQGDGKISGFIRIRSKTQGIALSLGDKITLKQRLPAGGKGGS